MTQKKKQDHSEWFPILVELRDSGIMNMWGAPRWLEEEYDLPKEKAGQIFLSVDGHFFHHSTRRGGS
jgi:hypothetical protein